MTAVRSLLAVGFVLAGSIVALADPPAVVPELPITRGGNRPVKLIHMAADGNWAAFSADSQSDDPYQSHRLAVWNLRTGALVRSILLTEAFNWGAPVVSPDGQWLAYQRALGPGYRVQLVDLRTGRFLASTASLMDYYHPLGFSADGREVYTVSSPNGGGGWSDKVVVFSTADGSKLREVRIPRTTTVVLSPDGKTVAVGQTELWDLTTGKPLHGPEAKPLKGENAVFLRGGKEVAVTITWAGPYPTHVYDVATGKQVAEILVSQNKDSWHDRRLLSDDRKLVAVLRPPYNLEVGEVAQGEPRRRFLLPEFTRWLQHSEARFTPDGKGLLVFDWFGRQTLLDTTTGNRIHTFGPDYRTVRSLAFADGGQVLLAGMAHSPKLYDPTLKPKPGGLVVAWDTATGELKRAAAGVGNDLRAVYSSPNADRAILVFGEEDNRTEWWKTKPAVRTDRAEWWDLTTGQRLRTLAEPADNVGYFGGSADGQKVAGVHHADGKPQHSRVWNPATGERLPDLLAAPNTTPLHFTPDGEWMLARSSGVGVQTFRTSNGKATTVWKDTGSDGWSLPPEEPMPLPDGESFVSIHHHNPWKLVLYTAGRQIRFGNSELPLSPLAVSPDGKWVAAGTLGFREYPLRNQAVYLWRVPEPGPLDEKTIVNGRIPPENQPTPRKELHGHFGSVTALAFSPDSKTLATGGWDGVIRLWDVPSGKLKASLWSAPPTDPDRPPSDWVAFTPDGFHAGTPRGRASLRLGVLDPTDLFLRLGEADPAEFFRPEKVRESLRNAK